MRVKANWAVDTGRKQHQAGDEFDVPVGVAKQLLDVGAVSAVSKADEKPPATPGGNGEAGSAGAGQLDGEAGAGGGAVEHDDSEPQGDA